MLLNTDPTADYEISRGDRIAQLVQRVEEIRWVEVDASTASTAAASTLRPLTSVSRRARGCR